MEIRNARCVLRGGSKILIVVFGASQVKVRNWIASFATADDRHAGLLDEIERMGVNTRAFKIRGAYPTFFDLMAAMYQEFVAKESRCPQRSAPPDVESESDSEESDDATRHTAHDASSLFPSFSVPSTTAAPSAASDPEIDRVAETIAELRKRRDALRHAREKALKKKKMDAEVAQLKMEIAELEGASVEEPVGGDKDEGSAWNAPSTAGDGPADGTCSEEG